MRIAAALAALCLGLAVTVATAQDAVFPRLVDVADVAADDVLNIRAMPSARAEIIGAFAHDATGVEVLAHSEEGRWAMVGVAEGNGWIARRFVTDSPLAPRLTCFGTEPFWTLQTDPAVLVTPEARIGLTQEYSVQSDGLGSVLGGGVYSADAFWLYLRTVPGACHDGMSDRRYGVIADVDWLLPGRGVSSVSGCCRIGHTGPLEEH